MNMTIAQPAIGLSRLEDVPVAAELVPARAVQRALAARLGHGISEIGPPSGALLADCTTMA